MGRLDLPRCFVNTRKWATQKGYPEVYILILDFIRQLYYLIHFEDFPPTRITLSLARDVVVAM